ncbi:hypothetical protein EDC04DRAFT_2606105 [Pisolithus marmoratus]|nr:hypothetical protein EDC04DRAFT_2606105 [Pisolithus marmoratus]
MKVTKTFILLAFAAYVRAQYCAVCPDYVNGEPIAYNCFVDDHTHCGYSGIDGPNEGSLIPGYSSPGICPNPVGSTTSCIDSDRLISGRFLQRESTCSKIQWIAKQQLNIRAVASRYRVQTLNA